MVSVKSVQKIETSDIADLSIITKKLNDLAVTTAKLADAAVGTPKIADGAVTTPKMPDSAVTSAKIANDEVGPADVSPHLVQARRDAIDSVEAYISFPTAFPAAPTVVAIGMDVLDVKVTDITSGSFSWVGAAAGSAYWAAFYYT